jgi:hypothetical protein
MAVSSSNIQAEQRPRIDRVYEEEGDRGETLLGLAKDGSHAYISVLMQFSEIHYSYTFARPRGNLYWRGGLIQQRVQLQKTQQMISTHSRVNLSNGQA